MTTTALVVGGGPIGLAVSMLLAGDGVDVTVLEKDPAPAPATVADAWESWERRGVAQFRHPHFLMPRTRQLLDAELPDVRDELVASGATQVNLVDAMAPTVSDRARRASDDRFETLTARRPVIERAFAVAADNTMGVKLHRGVAVAGPVAGTALAPSVPHVKGVRTADGDELTADLVIDAMGRRSKLPDWIAELGGRRPHEEASDTGFAYYTRHFEFARGTAPALTRPPGASAGSITTLNIPGDNDTWTIALVGMAGDAPFKALRQNDAWDRVAGALPHLAPYIAGRPISDVRVIAGVLDRYRRTVLDGRPSVTGIVPVGDSWACTNPTSGRGISLGLLHAVTLRDALRASDGDPVRFALTFDELTEQRVTPWYREQVGRDYQRAAEIQALVEGRPTPEPANPMQAAFTTAAMSDPDVARAMLDTLSCLALPTEVMARPGLIDTVASYAGSLAPVPPVPSRDELVALVSGHARAASTRETAGGH